MVAQQSDMTRTRGEYKLLISEQNSTKCLGEVQRKHVLRKYLWMISDRSDREHDTFL